MNEETLLVVTRCVLSRGEGDVNFKVKVVLIDSGCRGDRDSILETGDCHCGSSFTEGTQVNSTILFEWNFSHYINYLVYSREREVVHFE